MENIKNAIKKQIDIVNLERIRLFSIVLVILGALLIIADPFISNLEENIYFRLYLLHWGMLIVSVVALLFTFLFKNKKYGTQLGLGYAIVMGITGSLISGYVDSILGRGIYVYVFTVLAISNILFFRVTYSIIFTGISFLSFVTCLLVFEKNFNLLTGYLINGSTFTTLAIFLLIANYKRKYKEIGHSIVIANQQESIAEKNRILEEINRNLLNKNQEIEQQKEEIITQRDELELQKNIATRHRDQILRHNEEITDSIFYAKRIQKAIFPSEEHNPANMPEHFVFLKPKLIVSGDFYWAKQVSVAIPVSQTSNNDSISGIQEFALQQILVFCVADCTGHGIPGAFMSMLGITLLNEVVTTIAKEGEHKNISAGEILDKLRIRLKESLHQTQTSKSKDGIDIALCVYDEKNRLLQYAGANNSLLCIPVYETNRKFPDKAQFFPDTRGFVIRPDKMPIGYFEGQESPFTNHSITLEKGDMVYLFSDGYSDQFGGPENKKYLFKNFLYFLSEISNLPLDMQKKSLDDDFNKWKGEQEQMDDVTVMGLKF